MTGCTVSVGQVTRVFGQAGREINAVCVCVRDCNHVFRYTCILTLNVLGLGYIAILKLLFLYQLLLLHSETREKEMQTDKKKNEKELQPEKKSKTTRN